MLVQMKIITKPILIAILIANYIKKDFFQT